MNRCGFPRLDTEDHRMTVDEFLYRLQKETLNKTRFYLCDHLQPEKLLPWLQSKNVLNEEDRELIQGMNTTNKKVDKLVDIIIKAGPDAFSRLIKSIELCSKTQIFIAKKLLAEYESLKNASENKETLERIRMDSDKTTCRDILTPPPAYTDIPFTNDVILSRFRRPDSSKSETTNSTKPHVVTPPDAFNNCSYSNLQSQRRGNRIVRGPPVVGEWPVTSASEVSTPSRATMNVHPSHFNSEDFVSAANRIEKFPRGANEPHYDVINDRSIHITDQAGQLAKLNKMKGSALSTNFDNSVVESVNLDQDQQLSKSNMHMNQVSRSPPAYTRSPTLGAIGRRRASRTPDDPHVRVSEPECRPYQQEDASLSHTSGDSCQIYRPPGLLSTDSVEVSELPQGYE